MICSYESDYCKNHVHCNTCGQHIISEATVIANNVYLDRNFKFDIGGLSYSKTAEEEMEEKRKVSLAVDYLRALGVNAVTEDGYYRASYNILNDLGESLSKNGIR